MRRGKLATRCWGSQENTYHTALVINIGVSTINDEEAVQSQYRPGRCALRDGFVMISISVARFIEKRSKTPVGATTIGSFRLEYE